MKLSLNKDLLAQYLTKQLDNLYPDQVAVSQSIVNILPAVIERLHYCFSHIHKKYYFEKGDVIFNHLNSDHYAMFLYVVANEAFQRDFISLAEKAFLLNKALHGIDAFYSVALPEVFLFVHPIGTILGHAQYGNFFVVYQNVTIGADIEGIYPVFGEATVLYSKSSVIGRCHLGDNVTIAANSFLRNTNVPSASIVFGSSPESILKPSTRDNKKDFFS